MSRCLTYPLQQRNPTAAASLRYFKTAKRMLLPALWRCTALSLGKKKNTVYQTAAVPEVEHDEYPTPSPREPAAMSFIFHLEKEKIKTHCSL